jgi:Flp pilus assembly protein TadG
MDHREQLQRNQKIRPSYRRGQASAEFAMVMLLVLPLMIFGIIDFATALYTYSEVSYAANAGARWASVRGSTYSCSTCTPTGPATQDDISTYVAGMADWLNSGSAPSVTASWIPVGCPSGTTNCPGSKVQVQVQYNFPITVPFFSPITLPLTATTQMVISQ